MSTPQCLACGSTPHVYQLKKLIKLLLRQPGYCLDCYLFRCGLHPHPRKHAKKRRLYLNSPGEEGVFKPGKGQLRRIKSLQKKEQERIAKERRKKIRKLEKRARRAAKRARKLEA